MRLAIAILALTTATARADEPDAAITTDVQPYHHAISLQLATLDPTGAAVVYEHDLRWHKLTLAASLGLRSGARGDFASLTYGAGVEVRRWLRRPTTMRGLYAALRTDIARTRIEDMVEQRVIGSLTSWSLGASVGYRFVIANRVEITPSLGLGVVVETGMMPATARPAAMLGLTAGIVF